MAEKSQPITAPHLPASTTLPPNPPYTPRSASIPDDSETEFEPTPVHSPGGPQYEDLPPSYAFALSDARNGVASLDASQIEARRVSANEPPGESELWEYRMRGEEAGTEDAYEREEAPAYEGHVPVQHVARSETIPVGRVGDFNASPASENTSSAESDDPPHSIPGAWPGPSHGVPGGRGGHRGQPWTPFGAPGHGPFGAPDNGPFGHQFGQRSWGGQPNRGRDRHGARSGSSQDWAAFGQNLGKIGENFGRRMGKWGEQFGRQAGAMGEQFGRQAGAMGQQFGRDTGAWAATYSGRTQEAQSAHASESTLDAESIHVAGSKNGESSQSPRYDEPPSYQGPVGDAGQETSVLHNDRKLDIYPLEKVPEMATEKPSKKSLGKQKADDYDDNDDDSSISSDSSDSSSSSSDSDDDEYDSAQTAFLKRVESINKAAESAALKGKKSIEEIEHDRDIAIAKATWEKEETELKIARRESRRMQKKELRSRKRELTREYRQRIRDLRENGEGKGKGKGKAKKGIAWKEFKKDYKASKRALRREKVIAKREWRQAKREGKRKRKEKDYTVDEN